MIYTRLFICRLFLSTHFEESWKDHKYTILQDFVCGIAAIMHITYTVESDFLSNQIACTQMYKQ